MAEALYRKYRPQVFEDVVGQEPIERTLKNAIDQDKVSHAYLFCGPRGTGKTTTARLLAKALLCQNGPTSEPDGTCEDCELIADGRHPDVYELDAASRTGVENVREEIIGRVQFAPTRGRHKVYIIDEVHMLSTAAFNALLKTLEEPPAHVVFILCTTDPQKVPETIHSRCQRFDFRRIAPEGIVSRLGAICMAENVQFEGEALDLIAHRAEGGLRNALTSLEQIIAFENGNVTLAGAERLLGSIDSNDLAEIMAYVGKRDIANCFRWTSAYVETGADLAQFVRDMSEHVRNLYVLAIAGDEVELDVSETSRRELAGELQWFGADRASRLLSVLGDLSAQLRTSSNPRLDFEIALTRMVRPDSDLTLESLAERIEALESGYSAVAHVLPGAPAGSGQASAGVAAAPTSFEQGERAVAQPTVYEDPAIAAGASSGMVSAAGENAGAALGRGRELVEASVPAPAAVVPESGRDARDVIAASQSPDARAAAGGAPGEHAMPTVAPGGAGGATPSKLASLSNPASLQRIWQAALSTVKKASQAHGVLFMNTKARFDEAAGMLKVVFPADSAFMFNAAQKADVQEELAQALQKAVGAAVPFCYERASDSPGAAPASVHRSSVAAQATVAQPQGQPAAQASTPAAPATEPASAAGVPSAAPASAPAASTAGAGATFGQDSYDQVPYEEVPYDDVPYEPVPYEDFEGGVAEDTAALQAMLQAGFGEGVVLSEVSDE